MNLYHYYFQQGQFAYSQGIFKLDAPAAWIAGWWDAYNTDN